MADLYKHSTRRKPASLKLSTDSIPPQLPVYSSPPQSAPGWSRFDPFVDNPPDYPDSSEEADADESDQEVPAYKRRHPSPQVYISPFHSSPRKTRRPPHGFHSPSPSLTSHRPRNHAKSSGSHHTATNSDSYLDSLLARSVHALELSNTILQSSFTTKPSSMTVAPSTDSPADESLEESATGLSKRIMKSKDLQRNWIDDLEEIGKRVDSLYGEQTEREDGPGPSDARASRIPVRFPTRNATVPISQSLPISSGMSRTLVERRRGQNPPSLAVITPTSTEGQLNYSAHNRSHFVAPPPRALTVYIGSDDTALDAIKLPPTLGVRSPPQLTHSHLLQSATSSALTSPVLSVRTTFSDGQSAGTRTPELSCTTLRAQEILSSYVNPRRGPRKTTRSHSFGSNTSPIRPTNAKRSQASPTPLECPSTSTSPKTSRGRSLTPLKTILLDPQSNSPAFPSKPLTPPIEELSSANSSSESDTQTNFAVTSLRRIFMDDQALAMERERQLSASRSLSNSTTGSRTRPPPRLLAPSTLPETSTSNATASVTRLLTKNKHSSSTRSQSPPRQSSLRSPSRPSLTLTPGPSPSPSLLNFPGLFVGAGSGGSNNGSGRSTPNRVSFAALPESYANSKPGGPDQQFNRERRRKRSKSGGRTPISARSGSRSLEDDSDDGIGWGWWSNWSLTGNGATSTTTQMRFGQEVGWGMRPSPI